MLCFKNLPISNFSLANAFTTRTPVRFSSATVFISASSSLISSYTLSSFLSMTMAIVAHSGSAIRGNIVRNGLICHMHHRIMTVWITTCKNIIPIKPNAPWSLSTSSFTLDMISPVFILSKYSTERLCTCPNRCFLMSDATLKLVLSKVNSLT